ncbi:MAG: P1 family peptidase [Nitratireductor sp.]
MIRPGKRNLITDVPGIRVGNAQDRTIGTGATVIFPETSLVCAIDERGGAPGTQQVSLHAPEAVRGNADAIVFSGGSLYGFGAANGVTAELGKAGIGAGLLGTVVPSVPSAIIFDLLAMKHRDWLADPPYDRLGREALAKVDVDFDLGSVGAGIGASACSFAGGLGSASAETDDGLIVGALAVVNSFGEVVVPGTRNFWAWPFEYGDEFGGHGAPQGQAPLFPELSLPVPLREPGMSTTLIAVATNATLDKGALKRVAIMAQTGMARAIRPVHTLFDGDVVFALATCEREQSDPVTQTLVGNLAADCTARAIARAVYSATSHETLPVFKDRQ